MKLDTLLAEQFKNFSLTPIHHSAEIAHLYADYLELLTVLQNGEWFTESELVKRFMDFGIRVPNVSQKTAGTAQDDEPRPAEIDDQYDSWAQQVFSQLDSRQALFEGDYPFEAARGRVRLKATLDLRQKLYVMLLLCSNLRYFPKLEPALTSEFEGVAFEVLKAFLPGNATVRQLGKNSDYGGDAKSKISKLAKEMNVKINEREFQKIQGTQERGLDVVGWIPFSDRCFSFLSILAQCACGKNWTHKLSETRRFDSSYFHFEKLKPIHALFIPRGLNYKDDLYQSSELSEVLLFERGRILTVLSTADFFENFESKKIVDYYVALSEDIV
ncbi:MAG: hypothetical protein U0936_24285 [Planctomycetaceae bacterium]